MKRASTMFAALFLGTALAAAPALAADGGVARGANKDVRHLGGSNTTMSNSGMGAGTATASGNTVERGTKKETGTGSAMMSTSQMENLKTANVSTVKVVSAGDMATTGNSTANGPSTNTTPAEQEEIHSALEANPRIMKQLRAQSVQVSQVVAADYDGQGTLTVYTR